MPHFVQLNEANTCVNQLFSFFHGGTLWLDTPVPITMELILNIRGFPKDGPNPSQYFKGRDNDKRLAACLKLKYDLQHNGRAYRIDNINDRMVCISFRILASKIVHKNHPIQCTLGVIMCGQQCAERVQMKWSLFLLNQLT